MRKTNRLGDWLSSWTRLGFSWPDDRQVPLSSSFPADVFGYDPPPPPPTDDSRWSTWERKRVSRPRLFRPKRLHLVVATVARWRCRPNATSPVTIVRSQFSAIVRNCEMKLVEVLIRGHCLRFIYSSLYLFKFFLCCCSRNCESTRLQLGRVNRHDLPWIYRP